MIGKGQVELEQATLESPTTSYSVTGKASDNRKLDFKLIPEGSAGLTVDPEHFPSNGSRRSRRPDTGLP